jgi:hypothetical protein
MDNLTPSIEEEIADVKFGRPHVVILGAGASLAAFPHGEGNGIPLPLMADFVETLGIARQLRSAQVDYQGKNFEEVYGAIAEKPEYAELRRLIEEETYSYFSRMRLPNEPTIYDHLVLSLREKDLIATFNWDPFLYFACLRNHKHVKLPHCVYLHGNVAVGYCREHKTKGMMGYACSKCRQRFAASKLLFPILKKNYSSDPFISVEWDTLRNFLKSAYMVTIFGYSAPESDVEAKQLMKEAWGDAEKRDLEEFEIIDIKSQDEVAATWKGFIHTHHYITCNNFYGSHLARHPRRTCEAMWNQLMECKFLHNNPIPREMSLNEFYTWIQPLVKAEEAKQQ